MQPNNVTPEYRTMCDNIINIVDDYDKHTLADANVTVLDLHDAIDDVTRIVNGCNVATAMKRADTLLHNIQRVNDVPIERYVDAARSLLRFASKRGYTIHTVYATFGGDNGPYMRAVLVNNDGMARRAWLRCATTWFSIVNDVVHSERIGVDRWEWSTTVRDGAIKPLSDMRINKYHVTV